MMKIKVMFAIAEDRNKHRQYQKAEKKAIDLL